MEAEEFNTTLQEIIDALLFCGKNGKKCKRCKDKDECQKYIRTVLAMLTQLHMIKPKKTLDTDLQHFYT